MPPRLTDVLRSGPLASPIGAQLGPYVIDGVLGRGGMGVVYKATHTHLKRAVAIKVLTVGTHATPKQRARFLREAKLGHELGGDGVVEVHELAEEDGLLYVVFEFVEGATLGEVWDGASPERVLELIKPLLRTLARIHAGNVIHRDLKPDNVLVRASDGRPLLSDFGLGRNLAEASKLTKTGAVLGTPAYMAPEQIRGTPPSPATDIYAVGAMLYEVLTEQLPHSAPNLAMRLVAMQTKPTAPHELAPAVPRWLSDVVLRCLEVDPTRRYPDASALLLALEGGEPTLKGPRPPGQQRLLLGAGFAALFALSLAITYGLARKDTAPATDEDPTATTAVEPTGPEALREKLTATRDPGERYRLAQQLLREVPGDAEAMAITDRLRPWTKVWEGDLPEPRDSIRASWAYDTRRRRLLFGFGRGRTVPGVDRPFRSDTWAWDGSSWTEVRSTVRPPPRSTAVMAYDEARQCTVLFGGAGRPGERVLGDVWELRDDWTPVQPGSQRGPTARGWHTACYDPSRKAVVVFGGKQLGPRRYLADLWTWDGGRWQELLPADGVRPKVRGGAGIVHDPVQQRLLVFGGANPTDRDLGNLWAWKDGVWSEVEQEGDLPGPRGAVSLVGDGRRIYFLAASNTTEGTGFYVLEGNRWTRREPLVLPPVSAWHALALDPVRRRLVVWGGLLPGDRRRESVWEYPLEEP